MRLYRTLPGNDRQYLLFAEARTDDQGRYAVGGMNVGDHYYFKVQTADGSSALGWTHQMPYVQSIPAGAPPTIRLPDVSLVSSGQSLRGVVLDPRGNPVGASGPYMFVAWPLRASS
jgi:hypothetical protein